MANENRPVTDTKLLALVNVLGAEKAIAYATANPSEFKDAIPAADAATRDAARAAEHAKIASTNPFVKGPNFSMKEAGRLLTNPATRTLAIGLAKAANFKLPDRELTKADLNARNGW
jgi:hypothetical protein